MVQRFDKLIDAWDPVLQKAFMDSIYNLRDAAQLDQIIRALQRGDIDMAMRAVNFDPVAFRPFDKALTDAFEHGGNITSDALPTITQSDGLRVEFQFNVRNPTAEQWLSNNSAKLVQGILDDQRVMVRDYLSAGLSAGDNPTTTALDLVGRINPATGKREGGAIGLTTSQAQWVKNYEAELRSEDPSAALDRSLRDARFDASVQRAIDSGQPIPDGTITDMVNAYENRAMKWRAESIARTEAMTALHESQDQAIQQAVSTGVLPRRTVTFIWRTSRDKRVRESHQEMEGQEVAMGEMFVTGNGNYLRFPGDPEGAAEDVIQCRCWRETNVDFLAEAA